MCRFTDLVFCFALHILYPIRQRIKRLNAKKLFTFLPIAINEYDKYFYNDKFVLHFNHKKHSLNIDINKNYNCCIINKI